MQPGARPTAHASSHCLIQSAVLLQGVGPAAGWRSPCMRPPHLCTGGPVRGWRVPFPPCQAAPVPPLCGHLLLQSWCCAARLELDGRPLREKPDRRRCRPRQSCAILHRLKGPFAKAPNVCSQKGLTRILQIRRKANEGPPPPFKLHRDLPLIWKVLVLYQGRRGQDRLLQMSP